jgi:MarR family 2-MHQ and catechol resistance regulon transcriptional repressor
METITQIPAARLWLVLARAHGSIADYIERRMGEQGFCLSDFMVLEVLLHKGPLTISTIGEKVLLASASMTSAIDRLEKRGLVHRMLTAEDRRVRLVALTAEGERYISEVYAQHEKDLELIAEGLSAEEREVLYGALKKLGLTAKTMVPTASTPVKAGSVEAERL